MMPKSTATSRPSASTNRLPGCMSAWKKPSRSAWRRKALDHRAAERRQVEPLACERGAVAERRAVDPFEREHLARGAVPVDGGHAEIRIVLWCSRPFPKAPRLPAGNPVRSRPSAPASRPPRPGAAAALRPRMSSAMRAAKQKASRSRLKRRSMPGRRIFTATARGPAVARDRRPGAPARSRPRRPAGPKLAKTSVSGLPNAAATTASASACGNGGIWSCRLSRSRAIAVPTTSGRVARNWPSLT